MKQRFICILTILFIAISAWGCSADNTQKAGERTVTGSLELQYASEFQADYLEDGNILLTIADGNKYLVVTAGNSVAVDNPYDAQVIMQGSEHIYMAASSAMDLVDRLDGLDSISFCSTRAEDYSLEDVKSRIKGGQISYIGKYSAPDYEALLDGDCDLAIESTMIYHSPEIKEELERIGIPVLVERSSYESEPLGRLEWIKLYGILLGREEEAEAIFDEQVKKVDDVIERLQQKKGTDKSVAVFYVTSNGYINVRKSGDYLTRMIDIAGGSYALDSLVPQEDNALSTMNISLENFYSEAKDADILIYNGTVTGGISTLEDLYDKNEMFRDFKAVKTGAVYCSNMNMFQETGAIAEIIEDLYNIISEGDESQLKYFYRVK